MSRLLRKSLSTFMFLAQPLTLCEFFSCVHKHMWAQTVINPVVTIIIKPEWKWSMYQLYPSKYVINAAIYKKQYCWFVSTPCHCVGLHPSHLTLNRKVYFTLFVCEIVWGNIIIYAWVSEFFGCFPGFVFQMQPDVECKCYLFWSLYFM